MAALVNELLAFAKAGLRPRDVQQAPVALTPLVQRMLAREDAAQRVTADLAADLTVLADTELLERALANLVRNALRYAPTGPITLAAQATGAVVTITVADAGPGVPAEALARLGEPFTGPTRRAIKRPAAPGRSRYRALRHHRLRRHRRFRNRQPHGLETEITLGSPEPFTSP